MGRRTVAVILATVLAVLAGFVLGYASASAEDEPRMSRALEVRSDASTPVATPGVLPDYLGAVADLGALVAGWQAARDAAAAPLLALGWTPSACEPEVPGVPPLGDRPTCPPITPSVGHWQAINRCEQGGDWHAYGRFGNGLMGGGGLGISDGAWREWGGTAYAPTAAGASPWAQMVIASRGYARYGGSPWECKA